MVAYTRIWNGHTMYGITKLEKGPYPKRTGQFEKSQRFVHSHIYQENTHVKYEL